MCDFIRNEERCMAKDAIKQLEKNVEELLRSAYDLREENKLLKAKQARWLEERDTLIAQRQQARQGIDSMIERLKAVDDVL
jgi:cell division protein ZapB